MMSLHTLEREAALERLLNDNKRRTSCIEEFVGSCKTETKSVHTGHFDHYTNSFFAPFYPWTTSVDHYHHYNGHHCYQPRSEDHSFALISSIAIGLVSSFTIGKTFRDYKAASKNIEGAKLILDMVKCDKDKKIERPEDLKKLAISQLAISNEKYNKSENQLLASILAISSSALLALGAIANISILITLGAVGAIAAGALTLFSAGYYQEKTIPDYLIERAQASINPSVLTDDIAIKTA